MVSQNSPTFYKAEVLEIVKEGKKTSGSAINDFQDIKVRLDPPNGKIVELENGGQTSITSSQKVDRGEVIVVSAQKNTGGLTVYSVYDKYRFTPVLSMIILLAVFILAVARWKGLGSLVGLTVSLAVIFFYIIPNILQGGDPITVSILGSLVILFVSTYIAHGVSKQTTVALVSTFFVLFLVVFFSWAFTSIAQLSGFNEETSIFQFGPGSNINLVGLLLAGTIIGSLGALNDITTTQSATIFELFETDKSLTVVRLFSKGFLIGKEHIVSMINTLVLAYAGSFLTVFFFLVLNPQKIPLWVIVNSEDISDEIVRTVAGSMGLILAVPIVTLLAALVAVNYRKK